MSLLCLAGSLLAGDTAQHDREPAPLALTTGPSVNVRPDDGNASPPRPMFRRLALSGATVAWQKPPGRSTVQLSYAVLTRDLTTKGAVNCAAMKKPSFALEPSGIPDDVFLRELRRAFALWSDAANIDFVESGNEASADILFGAEATPRGHAFTNVTPATNGSKEIAKALVCLSPGRRWKTGFDGNLDVYDLRYTLAHEIGHAIGLDHPSRNGHLMSYRYVETSRGLSEGDRAGAIALYGARTQASN